MRRASREPEDVIPRTFCAQGGDAGAKRLMVSVVSAFRSRRMRKSVRFQLTSTGHASRAQNPSYIPHCTVL